MKLVDEWRHAWKWASVRLSALGALVMVLAMSSGDLRQQVQLAISEQRVVEKVDETSG